MEVLATCSAPKPKRKRFSHCLHRTIMGVGHGITSVSTYIHSSGRWNTPLSRPGLAVLVLKCKVSPTFELKVAVSPVLSSFTS